MMTSKVKIFLSYYKAATLLKTDVFEPIDVGRALRGAKPEDWTYKNLIGDDTGDNISKKNANYCELTAIYWAWKNAVSDLDYVGFMHYRRHLSFNTKRHFHANKYGLISRAYLDAKYIQDFGLSDDNIKNTVGKYDVLVAQAWDVRGAGSKNNYDHYAHADPKLHVKDYDLALKILIDKYPNFAPIVREYNASKYGYFTDIFVMRTDLFKEYCAWLFDILYAVEKRIDISHYDFQEARVYGYLSEWLTGIYITYLKKCSKFKIGELQRTFVENTDIYEPINIVFTCDDNYAKYMGVAIASILRHKNPNDRFKFYVVDGGIAERTKKRIESLKKISDFNIEYLNIDQSVFEKYPIKEGTHFRPATYYRLALADLLPNLDKVLYMDVDIIVRKSLKDLYNLDVSDKYLVGIKDILFQTNRKRMDLDKYVNAGVLLLNLDAWRKINATKKFIDFIESNRDKIMWCDQDVINAVLQEKIDYCDSKWNCQLAVEEVGLSQLYKNAIKNSAVIHYISANKPWNGVKKLGDLYWFKELIHTPWRFDAYKMPFGLFNDLIKQLFQISSTYWHAYRSIKIFGIDFYFPKNPKMPSVNLKRFMVALSGIIPFRSWRDKIRQNVAARVFNTVKMLYKDGTDEHLYNNDTIRFLADFCCLNDMPKIRNALPVEFYMIFISLLHNMDDYGCAEKVLNHCGKRYGEFDIKKYPRIKEVFEYFDMETDRM